MSLIVRNKTVADIEIEDFGVTVFVGTDLDLCDDYREGSDEFGALIDAGDLVFVTGAGVELSVADSIAFKDAENNPSYDEYYRKEEVDDLIDPLLEGPGSSVDNVVPRFDGTGGDQLQGSGVVVDDNVDYHFKEDHIELNSPNTAANLRIGWIDLPSNPDGYGIARTDTGGYLLIMPNAANPQIMMGNTDPGSCYIDAEHNKPIFLNYLDTGPGDKGLLTIGSIMDVIVSGTLSFQVEADGTCNVGATSNYENLVTNNNDIPNKKYVDDVNIGMEVYDAATGQNFTGEVTKDFDTVRPGSDTTVYTWDDTNNDIEINEVGLYLCGFEVSTDIDTGTIRSQSSAYLQIDTGGGFAAVPGSKQWIYNRTVGLACGTGSTTILLNVAAAGTKIRVRQVRDAGTSTLTNPNEGSRLWIVRLRKG